MRTKVVFVTLACLAAAAHADIVDMAFSSLGQGQTVRVSLGNRSFNTFAGQLLHEVVSASGAGEQLLGLNSFYCADVYQYTAGSPSQFLITGLTGVPDARPMSAEAAAAMSSIFADADGLQFQADAPRAYAAAFQLAVWEIASDYDPLVGAPSLDLSSGWFRARGPDGGSLPDEVTVNTATLFRAVEDGLAYSGAILALRSEQYQDQLTAVAGDRSIPTPGSSAVVLSGLVLAAGRRRA